MCDLCNFLPIPRFDLDPENCARLVRPLGVLVFVCSALLVPLFLFQSSFVPLSNVSIRQWPEAAYCSEDGKGSFFTCDYFTHLDTRQLQRRVKNEVEVRRGETISSEFSWKMFSSARRSSAFFAVRRQSPNAGGFLHFVELAGSKALLSNLVRRTETRTAFSCAAHLIPYRTCARVRVLLRFVLRPNIEMIALRIFTRRVTYFPKWNILVVACPSSQGLSWAGMTVGDCKQRALGRG